MPVPRCAIALLFCCSACGGEAASDAAPPAPPAPPAMTVVAREPPPLEQVFETVSEPVSDDASECGNVGPFDIVPLTPESVACTQHSDCRMREASCCPTCDDDNLIALRVGAEPFWRCCLPLPVCPRECTETRDPGVHAACIAGRCALVSAAR